MYVLVLASQKGGSGKTTLSGHLAVEAERAGIGAVALIDTDPQGSLSDWWNCRAADTPHFVKVGLPDLGSVLEQLRNSGLRLAVIDTPPAITGSISRVVAHADLVIIPTRPSPHDLRAVTATVDIAERHDKPLLFVVNGATQRARITGEAAVALSQHGTVAPVTVHHRVDFAASMVDGRTVGEVVPKSHSAREIRELWTYVQDRLARLARDPTLMPEIRPTHFSVGPLLAADESEQTDAAIAAEELLAPEIIDAEIIAAQLKEDERLAAPPPERGAGGDGLERRSGFDRRDMHGAPPFGSGERRAQPFGRRRTDVPLPVR